MATNKIDGFQLKITNLSLVGFSKWQVPSVGLELVPPVSSGDHTSTCTTMQLAEHPRGWDVNMHVWGAAQSNLGPKKGTLRRPSKVVVERVVAYLESRIPIGEDFQIRASVFESPEKLTKTKPENSSSAKLGISSSGRHLKRPSSADSENTEDRLLKCQGSRPIIGIKPGVVQTLAVKMCQVRSGDSATRRTTSISRRMVRSQNFELTVSFVYQAPVFFLRDLKIIQREQERQEKHTEDLRFRLSVLELKHAHQWEVMKSEESLLREQRDTNKIVVMLQQRREMGILQLRAAEKIALRKQSLEIRERFRAGPAERPSVTDFHGDATIQQAENKREASIRGKEHTRAAREARWLDGVRWRQRQAEWEQRSHAAVASLLVGVVG